MNSKTAIFFFVATLLVAHAENDVEKQPPQAGYILGGANTEFGVSSHILYVTYPGMEDETTATMEIENNGKNIHTYTMTNETEIKTPYTFFFALSETTDISGYTVKFCREDGTCSKSSSPPTVMDNGQAKLNCTEIDPDVTDIGIPPVSKYVEETKLDDYKQLLKGKSIAEKEGITKNPSYKEKGEGKGFMYFLVNYKLFAFKKFFLAQGDDEKFCQTKYTLSIITQVIDKGTKKILKRGRFTPKPFTNQANIEKYITGDNPEEVPIEFKLNISKEEVEKENLMIWQSVCVSAKDMVTSREGGFATKCSDPFSHDWQYTESGTQE